MKLTQTEFIKRYCKNSKMTEHELNSRGMFAIPCNCPEENCRGWAMLTKENLKSHIDLYLDTNNGVENASS